MRLFLKSSNPSVSSQDTSTEDISTENIKFLRQLYLLNCETLRKRKILLDGDNFNTITQDSELIRGLIDMQYKQLVVDMLCAKHTNLQDLAGLCLIHIKPRLGYLCTILIPQENTLDSGFSMAIRMFALYMASTLVVSILVKTMPSVAALTPGVFFIPIAIVIISLVVCLFLGLKSDEAKEQITIHNNSVNEVLRSYRPNGDSVTFQDTLSKAPLANVFKLQHADESAKTLVSANKA